MANHDQPVARAGGPIDRAAVEVAAGNGDAAGDLLLDQLEVSVLHQSGRHAVMGEGADLKDETALLKERITALASRDLPQRKELYELLEIVTAIAGDIEDAGDDLVNGLSRYKKGRHTFQSGGYLGDLMRAVIHFINRWGRTKDRLGDLKQKQQQLIDKSKDLLGTPPLPPGGNGHGPASATTPPPGDAVPEPIDVSTNGSQPQQPAEPTDPRLQPPQQPLPQPQPKDQAKGADDHG